MANFRTIDRQTGYLLPPSVDEWLPEKHLARFIVEVIDGLDLGRLSGAYRGSGSASYHPRMLLGLLVYGYATGTFSSRKLERATYDSVAFRFIAANDHPDHDTIAAFRRRFLKEIEELFVEVLQLAREMGVLKMGIIGLDGTKIHANASRHSALSYEHVGRIEAQLKAEVADLLARAEAADAADVPDGMSIPDELARREERLRKLAEAKAKIEARAKERHAREMAEHQAKMASREAKTAATGKKPGGKRPRGAGHLAGPLRSGSRSRMMRLWAALERHAARPVASGRKTPSISSAQCPRSGEPWNDGSTLSLLAASLPSPLRWPSFEPRTRTTAGTMASRSRRGSRPSAAGRMMSITFVPSRSDGTRLATMRSTSIPSPFRRVWRCRAKTASIGCSSTRTTALMAWSGAF